MKAADRKEMLRLLAAQLVVKVKALDVKRAEAHDAAYMAIHKKLAASPVAKVATVRKETDGRVVVCFTPWAKKQLEAFHKREVDSIEIPYTGPDDHWQKEMRVDPRDAKQVQALAQKLRDMDMALITADDAMAQRLAREFASALAALK